MLVAVATYLTYAEAVALYNDLREANIIALVKSTGPPTFPYGEGMYYQLLIEKSSAATAQELVAAFEAGRARLGTLCCPKCGIPDPPISRRLAWWKQLFYAGTTLHECTQCGAEFPV